ncbi:MAG: sodium:solute symporter [Candidatus Delongbacteria bacterium]|jgi:SSS family solute:Na+ symporter|nr:sodium:solute symporter [Candidatus Delongbacteria bacterium]
MEVKIIVLALYALTIIGLGIMGMKKTKSFSDFLHGGGKVGPWMSAFSYGTAYFSAVVFIGFAGKIGWGFGFSGVWIGICNALIGVLGVWWLMAWKIKQISTRYNISTMSEYFEIRYKAKYFKLYAALVIFVFMIPYSAAVFQGLSYLFEISLPGVEYWQAVVGMGLFTSIYLVMGGYKSMSVIDTFFGMIMTLGVIMLLFFTIDGGGGIASIVDRLSAIDPKLTESVGPPGLWPLFSLIMLTSVAPFAMPQLVQKFYAIKDKRSIKIGMIASTVFALLIGGIAYFVGSTGRLFVTPASSPQAFNEAGKPIFDMIMPELLTQIIPEYLFIIILVLILSASMSTLAALVLISSSTLTKDFYAGYINKKVSDKNLTLLTRIASVVFIVLSVALALMKLDTIVAILGVSWGAIGAAFLGPFIWGLFTNFCNKFGAYASSFVGLGLTIYLYATGWSSPEAGTIGMIVSLLLNPIMSFIADFIITTYRIKRFLDKDDEKKPKLGSYAKK